MTGQFTEVLCEQSFNRGWLNTSPRLLPTIWMKKLLQILPRVPPALCGVGDNAWNLALEFKKHAGIETRFLCAGTHWTEPGHEPRFPVDRLSHRTASSLAVWIRQHADTFDAFLLHVSPYGFQKRGVPFWLANGWRHLSQTKQSIPRLSYFHELYASGPPTTSSFWLRPFQKAVLRRIARSSSRCVTNRQAQADWLDASQDAGALMTKVLPVFSNLGELVSPPLLAERPLEMVLFLSANHSGEPASVMLQRATRWAAALGLERVNVVGNVDDLPSSIQSVDVVGHGFLEANQASDLVKNCRLAYTAYTPAFLAKSGIFALFAAHGVVVITQGRSVHLQDGLIHGQNVLNEPLLEKESVPNLQKLQEVASALRAWYEPHSLHRTSETLASMLFEGR